RLPSPSRCLSLPPRLFPLTFHPASRGSQQWWWWCPPIVVVASSSLYLKKV
ncbi:hypothetical protein L208DRAFT_1419592, partial [Tricholoma matsutake]